MIKVIKLKKNRAISDPAFFYLLLICEKKNLILPHPKPHLTCYIPAYPDIYSARSNIPKQFTEVLYSECFEPIGVYNDILSEDQYINHTNNRALTKIRNLQDVVIYSFSLTLNEYNNYGRVGFSIYQY